MSEQQDPNSPKRGCASFHRQEAGMAPREIRETFHCKSPRKTGCTAKKEVRHSNDWSLGKWIRDHHSTNHALGSGNEAPIHVTRRDLTTILTLCTERRILTTDYERGIRSLTDVTVMSLGSANRDLSMDHSRSRSDHESKVLTLRSPVSSLQSRLLLIGIRDNLCMAS